MARLSAKWAKNTAHAVIGLLGVVGFAQAVICGAFLCSYAIPAAAPLRAMLPFSPLLLLPGTYIALRGTQIVLRRFREGGLSAPFFYSFAISMFLLFISVSVLIYPAINPLKTPVELARAAPRKIPPGQPLLIYAVKGEILALYAKRPGKNFYNMNDLKREMRDMGKGIVVFTDKDWEKLGPEMGRPCVPHPFRMGSKRLVWVEFASDGQ